MTETRTPQQYRRDVFIAGILLAAIMVTGAAVRLSDAGLGCSDWPTCNQDEVLPEWEIKGLIEFGNRLLSGVVAIAVIATVLQAYRREPKRRDLIRWSWGLVAGVAAQIVLGGVTVLLKLHPAVVGMHYLLSLLLLWNVTVLWLKAGPSVPAQPLEQTLRKLAYGLFILATAIMLTGIVVTGTGPNSGDSRADRLPFFMETVARIHGTVVWLFLLCLTLLALSLARSNPQHQANKYLRWVAASALAQGAIGYLQYSLGVPPALVALHIIGSIAVWITTLLAFYSLVPLRQNPESMPL